eukprot:TRINITY_DN2315_c0_g1_i4.p1 TRINITY_DN2315_c0_g1~~TRINITY_DN2315_c0_g1_i4.p1  ORF type:complete len:379 (-),score=121.78 TRINITY_DN2315_c0_g1_i4:172-1308(-)
MSEGQGGEVSKTYIYGLMAGMVLTGAANTIVFKAQDEAVVLDKPYNHPFVQAFTMFFGEFLCLIAFQLQKLFSRNWEETQAVAIAEAEQKGLNTNVSKFWLLIPAGCDTLTSSLQLAGLVFVPPSIYQMMRGGVILVTAFLSVVALKRKLYIHHYLGLLLCIIGITLVGLTTVLYAKDDDGGSSESTDLAIFGIALLLSSLLTNGIMFVSEEKLFTKFYIEPLNMVGYEGIWGMLIVGLIFIPIASNIKCGGNICPYGYLEDPIYAIRQWGDSPTLLASVIAGAVILASFNFFGVSVTKNVSSLARAVLDVSRTVIVWVYALSTGAEQFYWLQLAGFLTLVAGNFIYNEIVEIPGLNKYTRRNLAKQSMLSASDEGNE